MRASLICEHNCFEVNDATRRHFDGGAQAVKVKLLDAMRLDAVVQIAQNTAGAVATRGRARRTPCSRVANLGKRNSR